MGFHPLQGQGHRGPTSGEMYPETLINYLQLVVTSPRTEYYIRLVCDDPILAHIDQ